jgi:hypothetical protein
MTAPGDRPAPSPDSDAAAGIRPSRQPARANRLPMAIAFGAGAIVGAASTLLAMSSGLIGWGLDGTGGWGNFPKTPIVELLDDGRTLKLIEDFTYNDPRKKVWTAQKGSIVDGASIPRPFWTVVGGPLEGPYRNASIIHDVACNQMVEPWEDVHRNFYEACRCGGVPEDRAKMLYYAVYHFGPRWERVPVARTEIQIDDAGKSFPVTKHDYVLESHTPDKQATEADARRIAELIKSRNPSLEELTRMTPD